MHQYDARALKLKQKSESKPRIVHVKVQPEHNVKTLDPELVWPGRRAVDYPSEYKPKPHPRQIEMREKKPL